MRPIYYFWPPLTFWQEVRFRVRLEWSYLLAAISEKLKEMK